MQRKHDQYTHDLTGKMAVLDIKETDLKRLKDTLTIYETEQIQLKENDQSLQLKIAEIDRQISSCENNICLAEAQKESLEKESERVFLLAFGKKNELKKQIENTKLKIEQENQKCLSFSEEKKELEGKRKLVEIGVSEERIKQMKISISDVEQDITNLKNSIDMIREFLSNIDDEIAAVNQARMEAERKAAEEKARLEAERKAAE